MSSEADVWIVMREADLEKWFQGMVSRFADMGIEVDTVEDLPVEKENGIAFRESLVAPLKPLPMNGLSYLWFENVDASDLTADRWEVPGVPFYGMHHEIIEEDLTAHIIGSAPAVGRGKHLAQQRFDHPGTWSCAVVAGVVCWVPEMLVPVAVGPLDRMAGQVTTTDVPADFARVQNLFVRTLRHFHAPD
jgi:hypothetical protein